VSHSQRVTLRRYIENQEEHHRTRTFREEYLELLQRHGVEFDSGMCFDPSPLPGLMSSSVDIPVVGRKYAPQRVSVVATYWP
jgi:hypothetical protein